MILLWLHGALAADLQVHEETIGTDDTLVWVADHRAPVVYLRLDVPVGTAGPWGRQHDAQTAWEVQPYDPQGTLRQRADALAVSMRFDSGRDISWLSLSCLVDDLDAAVDLALDALGNTAFDKAEIKRWNKGARISWKDNQHSAGWRASQQAAALLFTPRDPRRIGYEQYQRHSTDQQDLAQARDAIWHHPQRVLGIAGDVSLERARAVASRLLPLAAPALTDADPVYGPVVDPGADHPPSVLHLADLTQVTLRLVRPGLTYDDPDHPAALIANHVLAGHAHARLGQALRYDDGSTYGVGLYGAVGLQPYAMQISTSTRADNADFAEERMRETLALFQGDGITATELADAKTHLVGRAAFRQQNPWTPMAERMWELRHELPPGRRQLAEARAAELTLDAVNEFISRFYDPGEFTTVRVQPK